jgi:CBS domain-containing protein
MAQTGNEQTPLARVLKTDGPAAQPGDSLIDTARALVAARASEAPVLDPSGSLIGIISEHDILSKAGVTVADVMSRGVITIGADASAAEAAQLMGLHGVHILPVVDGSTLAGVVTRSDLLRLYVERPWECDACHAIAYGLNPPQRCPQCGAAEFHREAGG